MKTIKRIELRVRREKLSESRSTYGTEITTPKTGAGIIRALLLERDQEIFIVLPLDVKYKVLGYVEAARGAIDICPVDPREVFRAAVIMGASAIIIGHNHPSGDLDPSPEDLDLTKRLVQAGQLLNVQILDHIIVTNDGHTSLKEKGLMPEWKIVDGDTKS